MQFSYTQIAQYLRCPRSYRHRYLDGWREKETRAAMIFGRCFEKALEAYFCGGDCGATLHREWGAYRDTPFDYKKGETWDRLVHQGVHLLERFAQDNRIRIPQPQQNLQLKVVRELPSANQFVAYIDAIGELDGRRCLMDWKTTTSSLSRRTHRVVVTRPTIDLLFLDDRDLRGGHGCLRTKASTGDPIPEDIDFGRTTPGIWPARGSDDRPDRGRAVSFPQRDSFSTERLRELLTSRALSR